MNEQTARFAVFQAPNHPLELRRAVVPRPQAGELLVEIICCTLCGSDLHTYQGRRSSPRPTILGHEIVGRVLQLGDQYSGTIERGERVTWSLCSSCGECFYCRQGIPQKCVQLFKYGHQALDQGPLSGGLASHCILRPGTAVYRVPESLRDEEACPANCATATVMAALRAAGCVQGRHVLVFGAGMLGLTAAAAARVAGAVSVIVTDPDRRRVQLAEQFGATHAIHASDSVTPLANAIAEATGGHGADVVLEFSGATAAVRSGIAHCRIGGCLILVGSVFPTETIPLEPLRLVQRLLTLRGVHNYTPADLAAGLDFLAAQRHIYNFASLVEAEFSLEEADEAFRFAVTRRPIRVAVRP
jgi:alcohol dehydrogenase